MRNIGYSALDNAEFTSAGNCLSAQFQDGEKGPVSVFPIRFAIGQHPVSQMSLLLGKGIAMEQFRLIELVPVASGVKLLNFLLEAVVFEGNRRQ